MRRNLDPNQLADTEDWLGNNAAFTCPICGKVFIASARFKRGQNCPKCGKSTATVKGGKKSGGIAFIVWSE